MRRLALALGIATVTWLGLAAADAPRTARQILDERKALDDGPRRWTDRQERMRLTTVRRGTTLIRELEVFERRDGDEKTSILFLQEPRVLKGMAFLAFTHPNAPNDLRSLLPPNPRVRRVSGTDRSGSFFDSVLSFEDVDVVQEMLQWTEDDATAQLRGEERIDDVDCDVIELTPKSAVTSYRKIVVWLGKRDLVPRQLELFASDAEPVKRLGQRDIRSVDAIPVAFRVEVEDLEKHNTTTIVSSDVRFNQHLDADLFTERAMLQGGR
ncbi:MAG TPA: outer membrane lipoprotein-sorting protein [Candidatus Binatia bacterium]|jgi:hypothetical protein|nr:outer membrane lipoprotein-sorting protein [Candidatus Binatia bacterium]